MLATGSQPVRPPIEGSDLPGVVTFRDLADIEAMRAAAPGSRAVVVGGGLLGIEAAYGLARAGLRVTPAAPEEPADGSAVGRPRRRAADRQAIEAKGIEVVLQCRHRRHLRRPAGWRR